MIECPNGRLTINILHLNIRSLHKNLDNLTFMLAELRECGLVIHVIGLCETFLTADSASLGAIENYQMVHRYRNNKLGGGTSLLIHDMLRLNSKLDSPFNESFESVSVEVLFKGNKILVSEIYRPPNLDNIQFYDSLCELLDNTKSYKNSFVCGDFNYDLLKTHLHVPTSKFYSAMLENNYVPYVNKPT